MPHIGHTVDIRLVLFRFIYRSHSNIITLVIFSAALRNYSWTKKHYFKVSIRVFTFMPCNLLIVHSLAENNFGLVCVNQHVAIFTLPMLYLFSSPLSFFPSLRSTYNQPDWRSNSSQMRTRWLVECRNIKVQTKWKKISLCSYGNALRLYHFIYLAYVHAHVMQLCTTLLVVLDMSNNLCWASCCCCCCC